MRRRGSNGAARNRGDGRCRCLDGRSHRVVVGMGERIGVGRVGASGDRLTLRACRGRSDLPLAACRGGGLRVPPLRRHVQQRRTGGTGLCLHPLLPRVNTGGARSGVSVGGCCCGCCGCGCSSFSCYGRPPLDRESRWRRPAGGIRAASGRGRHGSSLIPESPAVGSKAVPIGTSCVCLAVVHGGRTHEGNGGARGVGGHAGRSCSLGWVNPAAAAGQRHGAARRHGAALVDRRGGRQRGCVPRGDPRGNCR